MMTSKQLFEYGKTSHTATELLEHTDYSHSRLNDRWNNQTPSVLIYFRCSDSPSGVLLAGSFKLNPENEALLRGKGIRANTGPSRGEIASANPPGTVNF